MDTKEKIKRLTEEAQEILIEIENKIRNEVEKEDFELNNETIDKIFILSKENVKRYYNKIKEIKTLEKIEFKALDEIFLKAFVNSILTKVIFEMNFVIKLNRKGEIFIFKKNKGALISFLIENFNKSIPVDIGKYEIIILRNTLKKYIKYFGVDESYIEELKGKCILKELKNDEDSLFIELYDSREYTNKNENQIRQSLVSDYNLDINRQIAYEAKNLNSKIEILSEEYRKSSEEYKNKEKEFENKITNLQNSTTILQDSINNSKLEGVTILTIFVCVFSYVSSNLDITERLLFGEGQIESIFLITALFCIGLIPVIVMFTLLKSLFPKTTKEKTIKEKLLSIFYIIPILIVIGVYIGFWQSYKKEEKTKLGEALILEAENKKLILNLEKEINMLKIERENLKEKIKELELKTNEAKNKKKR